MGDIVGGGKDSSSSSSSSSSTTTNTTNIDRRQVVAEGGVGVASETANVNVESVDGELLGKALDVVAAADATAGAGFNQLLTLTEKMFSAGGQLLDKTANTSMLAVDAVSKAQGDAAGTIDQRTLVILGAVGLGAAYLFKKKG